VYVFVCLIFVQFDPNGEDPDLVAAFEENVRAIANKQELMKKKLKELENISEHLHHETTAGHML
jgi:hypothetical protein